MDIDQEDVPDTFQVKEAKGLDIFVSGIFWLMFFCAVNYNEFQISNPRLSTRLFYLTIIPAILFLAKAASNKVIIEVNNTGIYYFGDLVTNWSNFISANYSQDEIPGSYSDNFVLLIEYYNSERGTDFVSKISLGNTQNKSEEEIIAAIEKYYSLSIKQ